MRSRGVWVRWALAGAVVLVWGADARSQEAKGGARPIGESPQATAGARPIEEGSQATSGVTTEPFRDPAALAAAESIVAGQESAANRQFDPAYRAGIVKELASKSLDQLAAIRATGNAFEPNFLGSTVNDFVYTPVAPCRIIDTRAAGGPIAAGNFRNFYATGNSYVSQGGFNGSCGVPFGAAKAVVINFVAVGGVGTGNLGFTPYPQGFTNTAILNWNASTADALANGLTVAICNTASATCTFDFSIAARGNATNVVADIQGYFAAPFATSLDVNAIVGSYFTCPGGFMCWTTQPCGTGYTITGGGCMVEFYTSFWTWANSSHLQPPPPDGPGTPINGWVCQGVNTGSISKNYRAIAFCSRVPGR